MLARPRRSAIERSRRRAVKICLQRAVTSPGEASALGSRFSLLMGSHSVARTLFIEEYTPSGEASASHGATGLTRVVTHARDIVPARRSRAGRCGPVRSSSGGCVLYNCARLTRTACRARSSSAASRTAPSGFSPRAPGRFPSRFVGAIFGVAIQSWSASPTRRTFPRTAARSCRRCCPPRYLVATASSPAVAISCLRITL